MGSPNQPISPSNLPAACVVGFDQNFVMRLVDDSNGLAINLDGSHVFVDYSLNNAPIATVNATTDPDQANNTGNCSFTIPAAALKAAGVLRVSIRVQTATGTMEPSRFVSQFGVRAAI